MTIYLDEATASADIFTDMQMTGNLQCFDDRKNHLITLRRFIAEVHELAYSDDFLRANRPYFNREAGEQAREDGRFDNWFEDTCYTGLDNLTTAGALSIERDDLKRLHAIVGTCGDYCKYAADATHAWVLIKPKEGEFKDLIFSYKREILEDDKCTIKTTVKPEEYHALSCEV